MKLPNNPSLRTCFWSYRLEDLDTDKHQSLIIKQILEYGNAEATAWLQSVYSKADIVAVIESSMTSEWSKKTKNYLRILYNTEPQRQTRFA